MRHITSPSGVTLSYTSHGSGPPLALVHGSFSNHESNWEFVRPLLEQRFTLYAVARRGRGDTTATQGHSLEEESEDIVALLEQIGEPAFLLGHSYGAQVALAAAARAPQLVRKLVLYEPPWPTTLHPATQARLEGLGQENRWEDVALTFFRDALGVPEADLAELRATEIWPPIVADAAATLGDLRALSRYDFDVSRFGSLTMPVLLQVGAESPRDFYITDALAPALPEVRIEELPGQAHEAMTTAPDMYAEAVTRFLQE